MSTIEQKSIIDRVAIVHELLRPDEIRNHRVAEGVELTPEQEHELTLVASVTAEFSNRMGILSQTALDAPSSDRTMRMIREMLGTEPLFQAHMRGEIDMPSLPVAEITKADLIMTADGVKIVEIEPGKIRGMGYGHMTRQQAENPLGIGSEAALQALSGDQEATIIMSEADKFHEPEMAMLTRDMGGIGMAMQRYITNVDGTLRAMSEGQPIDQAIMMSAFHSRQGKVSESSIREQVPLISDRRLDLESKGSLALVHNLGLDPELEALLTETLGSDTLQMLRATVPPTLHFSLLTFDQQNDFRQAVASGELALFMKPLAASGTRGIVTPDKSEEIAQILDSPKLARRYVMQQALPTTLVTMNSRDVLHGNERTDEMNVRITIHVDRHGNIVETSVVGSPHDHLAHGGKSSVITNLEGSHIEQN